MFTEMIQNLVADGKMTSRNVIKTCKISSVVL